MAKNKNSDMAVTVPQNEVRYRGVHKRRWGRYSSAIKVPGQKARVWLGTFDTAEEAVRVYDTAQRHIVALRLKLIFLLIASQNVQDDDDKNNNNNNHRVLSMKPPRFDHFSAFNTDGTASTPTELDKYYAEVLTRAGVIIWEPTNFSKGIVNFADNGFHGRGCQDQPPTITSVEDHNIELNLELRLAPSGSM